MIIYETSDRLKSHTLLADVIPGLAGYHTPLTWMFTDLECNFYPSILQKEEPILISGIELDALVRNEPHLQIIWGVLSGFRLPPDKIDLAILPESEGPVFWDPSYEIQHPQAECELVGWDSSATFFRSKNKDALSAFCLSFPEAEQVR